MEGFALSKPLEKQEDFTTNLRNERNPDSA
jgi:hypothetical protein